MAKLDFLASLNEEQQQAVYHTDSPLMVVAGPGTGKTSTLVAKILYLIKEKQFEADSILALTFTHKAAGEIQDRVKLQLGDTYQNKQPLISTFHGLAHRLLKNQIKEKNLIEETQRIKLIKDSIKQSTDFNFKQLTVKELSLIISKWKNLNLAKNKLSKEITDLIKQYNQQLKQKNLYDYDDLLVSFLENLKNKQIKQIAKFKYFLVDEFQDTNQIQYQILLQLLNLAGHQKIAVIGDPNQAIYAFRGAQAEAFSQFDDDFQPVEKIILNQNYRSSQSILDLSAGVFDLKQSLIAATTDSQHGQIQLINTTNQFSEADYILEIISSKLGGMDLVQASAKQNQQENQTGFADFAIIYRIHALAKIVEKKLADAGIPFQIVGSDSLYQKPEVKLLISALRFIDNQTEQDWQKLIENKVVKIKPEVINKLVADYQRLTPSLADLVDQIIHNLALEQKFTKHPQKLRNIFQFKSLLLQFDHPQTALKDLLEYIDNLAIHDYYDQSADKITLMTMHAAKGLEFKHVFVIGFEEGLIPYTKKINDNRELAEEKRLFYVAMTRAKRGLYLFKTNWRYKQKTEKSQFENLLDKSLIEEIEDENLERYKKKLAKKEEKENQLGLF